MSVPVWGALSRSGVRWPASGTCTKTRHFRAISSARYSWISTAGFPESRQASCEPECPRLLETLRLADRAGEPISRYSKGMVQRLALAHSLLADPDLLVLDEPMEGLDFSARLLLQEIVTQQRHAGKSVLVVSHNLGEVAQVCDRVAVLVGGRLAYLGSVDALLREPGTGLERSLEAALAPIYSF